jgi:hypothetical protein
MAQAMGEVIMRSTLQGTASAFMGGIGLCLGALPAVADACSVCFGSSPEDQGYFWGILFLMAMPFLVAGSVGGWLFYQYRRPRRAALSTLAGRPPN